MNNINNDIPKIWIHTIDGYHYVFISGNHETELSKEQLKDFRNHIHNLLIELNQEVGYE